MQSSNNKPQFGQWLIDQVFSGDYEGLKWLDNNKFRIPWKHNSRKDISDKDGKIFKAWAEASGKIREHPTDKAKWKTNFRCALHSLKKFRLVEDHSKDSDDPHKVYQVLGFEYNYEELPAMDPPPVHVDTSYPLIEDLYNTDHPTDTQHRELLHHMDGLSLNNHQPDDHIWDGIYDCNAPAVPSALYPNQPLGPDTQMMSQNNLPPQVVEPYNSGSPNALNSLEITIHYRNKEVLKTTVSSPRVQLHYTAGDLDPHAYPICFPSTEHLRDHKQIEYTQRILSSVQRGLLIETRESGVYAMRQDKCHVFASTSAFPDLSLPHPAKLPQRQAVELLNFEKYLHDLRDFQSNRQRSPEYSIYLCFGEKFPDGKPRERKLITVKVVPLVCQLLHERAQEEGASSLRSGSISLQISLGSLYELLDSLTPHVPLV